jgi:hypothetical protein
MATEVLVLPSDPETLLEVVRVLRYGVETATFRKQLRRDTRNMLLQWCGDTEGDCALQKAESDKS